jgi:hypothetical protein
MKTLMFPISKFMTFHERESERYGKEGEKASGRHESVNMMKNV